MKPAPDVADMKVGQASRLPSKDLRPQARRPRYLPEAQKNPRGGFKKVLCRPFFKFFPVNPENPVLLSKRLVSGTEPMPGFSLVEVVIALGIVSFAVVAIVGMLPMALKTAKDSMFETDATLAARRVFSELQTGSGTNRTVSTGDNTSANISLAANSTNILAFKSDGKPMFTTTSLAANPVVDFFAEILVSTNTGIPNLSQVQVNISHPAAAPPNARTTNSFTSLIGF